MADLEGGFHQDFSINLLNLKPKTTREMPNVAVMQK